MLLNCACSSFARSAKACRTALSANSIASDTPSKLFVSVIFDWTELKSNSFSSANAVPRIGLALFPSDRRRMVSSARDTRSEEHTSELQSLMRISYAVFCLKKKKLNDKQTTIQNAAHNTLLQINNQTL